MGKLGLVILVGKSLIPGLALLGVAFVWGATFYFVREALKDIAPFHFLFYRFILASLFLLALTIKERPSWTRKTTTHGFMGCCLSHTAKGSTLPLCRSHSSDTRYRAGFRCPHRLYLRWRNLNFKTTFRMRPYTCKHIVHTNCS